VALSRKSPYVDTKHKVSGMMLANHTCMAELMKRALAQYDTIISRNAYLHQVRLSSRFRSSQSKNSWKYIH